MSHDTTPRLFIIESDYLANEGSRSEGAALTEVLRMMELEPIYRYIRTAKELAAMAREFSDSGYRYLHLSCHGDREGFGLALDDISFGEFGAMFSPHLKNRRLFLSACSIAQPALARELFRSAARLPYSITGPSRNIDFADAAVTWASLYNLLFRRGSESIKGKNIRGYLDKLCTLNGLRFVHFGRTTDAPYFKTFRFPTTR
jgi:hypothetical protein